MDKCFRIVVSGMVQGVGYRYFARRIAKSLGLRGWARNRPDGSVELLAEGNEDDLLALVEGLRQGPLIADVETVEVEEVPTQGHAEFEVLR